MKFSHGFVKKGIIVVDKSTNKVHFRQMEKSIQKVSTIGIGFGNWLNANFFDDQTICIADCENLTIGNSLVPKYKPLEVRQDIAPLCKLFQPMALQL